LELVESGRVSEWTSKRINELCVTKDITCLLVYLSTRLLVYSFTCLLVY